MQVPVYELCSVDVWDTLLRRRCHPDAVKLHIANVLLERHGDSVPPALRDPRALLKLRLSVEADQARRARAAGFDDEYSHAEVLAEWLSRAVPSLGASAHANLAVDLEREEVLQEERVSYADPGIEAVLDGVKARRFIFVSDFYMSAERLFTLLASKGLATRFADGLSSCDVKLNKRSGRLFQHLHAVHHVAPRQHLHVGDNALGDVRVPKRLGISVLQYQNPAQQGLARTRGQWLVDRRSLLREVTRRCTALAGGSRDEAWRQGLALAPLFAGFAQFIVESARRDGVQRLLFCTREGELFARACETVLAAQARRAFVPAPERLEVSRLATFAASLREGSIAEMQRLWSAFPQQTLRAWAASLGLPPALVARACAGHGLDFDAALDAPGEDPRVQSLLGDAVVRSALAECIAQKRSELKAYLRTLGLPSNGRLGLVDIGWRGTIQDNLALLTPGIDWRGYYLGLQEFLNPQPANASKAAFGPDLNRSQQGARLFRHLPLLELVCSAPGGSVIGYDVDEHGAVRARRRPDPAEDAALFAVIRDLQRGILAGVDIWAEAIPLQALSAAELRAPALDCWEKLLRAPPRVLARAMAAHAHDETFGRGRAAPVRAPRHWLSRVLSRVRAGRGATRKA